MVLTVFAGIAEFERELIHERTNSGRISAKGVVRLRGTEKCHKESFGSRQR